MKTYSGLIKLNTFEDRYSYLCLYGKVADHTFNGHRYLNQLLYKYSSDWKRIRKVVMDRDNFLDLGIRDITNFDRLIVHHIEPLTIYDFKHNTDKIFDLDNLITTTDETHRGIHYGKRINELILPVERYENDTIPWR